MVFCGGRGGGVAVSFLLSRTNGLLWGGGEGGGGKERLHTGVQNTLICRSGKIICNGEGGENKEHGIICNEQYKHGGSM